MNEDDIKTYEIKVVGQEEDSKDSEALWDQYINEEPSGVDEEKDSDSPPMIDSSVPEPAAPSESEPFSHEEDIIPYEEEEDVIDPVNLKLDDIQEQIRQLQQEFQKKIKFDSQKNKIIDNLHQELQEYKDDIVKKYFKSFIMDIIQFADNIRKLSQFYHTREPSEKDTEKLLDLLENIPSDLEDICARQGVNPFNCEGDKFDPRRQRVLKKIETGEESEDKNVAESLHPGYEWDGKIIRPEIVSVYDYKAPPVDTEMRNSDE